MKAARNAVRFPTLTQLMLPIGAQDATEAEVKANFDLFDAYFAVRRESKRPASMETLRKDRTQWRALCHWFLQEHVRAQDATEATFNAFFASDKRASSGIRNHVSYLRLYNRVMYANALLEQRRRQSPGAAAVEHDPFDDAPAASHDDSTAPGRVLGLQWNRVAERMMASDRFRFADMAENKRAPVFLSERDDRALREHFYRIPEAGSFASLRTFVLMAAIRGSGASPGEVRTLQLEEIDRDAKGAPVRLRMFGRSGNSGHVYALEDFAARALHYWLEFNLSPRGPAELLRGFPEVSHPSEAKRTRFVFPNLHLKDERYGQPIDGDTATRAVRAALHELGFRVSGSITQMLRTQYATSALLDGDSPAELVERMGMYDTRSVKAYVAIAAQHSPSGAYR